MTLRAVLTACIVSAGLLSCSNVSGDTEMPDYVVERTDRDFEIRRYDPLIFAEVTTSGTRQEAAGKGFRQLAAYIFNKERPEGGIAMTAPVITQPVRAEIAGPGTIIQAEDADGEWTMAFSMPPEWTLATLPKPANPAIRVYEQPSRKVAAIRFSGRAGDRMLRDKEALLTAWLVENGITATGPAEYAFYNDPWVIGPLRRNEVLIPVE